MGGNPTPSLPLPQPPPTPLLPPCRRVNERFETSPLLTHHDALRATRLQVRVFGAIWAAADLSFMSSPAQCVHARSPPPAPAA